jgi:hypothetical protein
MSFQVDTALVQAYHANIQLLSQQMGSRLAGNVRVETQSAKYDFYDRVDATSAAEVTTRHADTPLISTPHDRRRVGLRDFDWADLIDKKDRIRMLADPTSAYTLNALAALGRAKDQVIIDSAFASAATGETGTGTQALTLEVAVDYVESGGPAASNLTIGKLRRARSLIGQNEGISQMMGGDGQMVDEPLLAVVKQQQLDALLRTTEVTSGDYNTVKALVDGKVDTFMGFKFIRTQLLTTDSSNITDCIFYAKSGLLLAMGLEIMTDIGPRRDKRNSVQVYVCGSFGSVRMEEKKVVRVKCDDDL